MKNLEKGCKIGAVFQNAFISLNPTIKNRKSVERLYESHYGNDGKWKEEVTALLKKLE